MRNQEFESEESLVESRDLTVGVNDKSKLTELEKHRLQDVFKCECLPFIENNSVDELNKLFTDWVVRFKDIKDKEQFNHWDNDDSSRHFRLDTGLGWTSLLLENSRVGGKINWVSTKNSITDFSMASMELNLGISSKNNKFSPGM